MLKFPKLKPLEREEEVALARRAREGDRKALDELVLHHAGLAVPTAQRISTKTGVPLEELIQEGCVGLLEAAKRFDPERGVRFATYATYWVRALVMNYATYNAGPTKFGTRRSERKVVARYAWAKRSLEAAGLEVTSSSVANMIGVEEGELEKAVPRIARRDLAIDVGWSDERYVAHPERTSELAYKVGPEDAYAEAEEADFEKKELERRLNVLDRRELMIVKARYLLKRQETLEALGEKLGVTRERVRQIESRAIRKMRAL